MRDQSLVHSAETKWSYIWPLLQFNGHSERFIDSLEWRGRELRGILERVRTGDCKDNLGEPAEEMHDFEVSE
jgi:hypothetical protein